MCSTMSTDSSSSTDFQFKENRDAWATIRGYLYQIDLTIERWLLLKDGEVLDLERGEDIDEISRCIGDTSVQFTRRLEQVKHRDTAVSLNSSTAKEFIVNAIDHVQNNPTWRLRFRFSSNARVARENLSPLPDRLPGILAWKHVCGENLEVDKRSIVIKALLALLRSWSKPDNIADDLWKKYTLWIHSTDEAIFTDFVRTVEWSVELPEAVAMEAQLIQLLISRNLTANEQEGATKYRDLLAYVLKLLSQPGIKRITSEDLRNELQNRSVARIDSTYLVIANELSSLHLKVESLEQAQKSNEKSLSVLNEKLQAISETQETAVTIQLGTIHLNTSPPPPVSPLAPREMVVREILNELSQKFWVHLIGGSGTGRTQLARLIASATGRSILWLRLRDYSDQSKAAIAIDFALRKFSGIFSASDTHSSENATEMLNRDSIIVLDDLPRFTRGDALAEILCSLCRIAEDSKVIILSTSHFEIPSGLRERLSQSALEEKHIPVLSLKDTTELLIAYGASEPFIKAELPIYVNTIVSGHPQLLAAAASYLSTHGWSYNDQNFKALIAGTYANPIESETMERFLDTVKEQDTRELLYRLNLVIGAADNEILYALAEITPTISRVLEHMHVLLGPWISSDSADRYLISPLLSSLGEKNLPAELKRVCCSRLADLVLLHKSIDIFELQKAVLYLLQGERPTKAVFLMARALMSIRSRNDAEAARAILGYWIETPLPSEVEPGIRLLFRTFQIVRRTMLGLPIEKLLDELPSLLSSLKASDEWSELAAAIYLQPVLAKRNYKQSLALLTRVLNKIEKITWPDGTSLTSEATNNLPFEMLLWDISSIKTPADLLAWLSVIEALSAIQRTRFFQFEQAPLGIRLLTDSLWRATLILPPSERDWSSVLNTLDQCARRALTLGSSALYANSARARCLIQIEFMGEVAAGLDYADETLRNPIVDLPDKSALYVAVGLALLGQKQSEQAKNWLLHGIEIPDGRIKSDYVEALSALAVIEHHNNPEGALQRLSDATAIADADRLLDDQNIRIRAQMAIIHWNEGRRSDSFNCLDVAAEKLLSKKLLNDEWKDLFMRFGHTTGYFTSLATSGSPPDTLENGDIYLAPVIEMFRVRGKAGNSYNERTAELLPIQLAMFARAINREDAAYKWAVRALEKSGDSRRPYYLATTATELFPEFLAKGDYSALLEIAIQAGSALLAVGKLQKQGKNFIHTESTIDEVLGPKPSTIWNNAEAAGAIFGVVTLAIHTCRKTHLDARAGKAIAREIADCCQLFSASASDIELWRTLARLFRTFAEATEPASWFREHGKTSHANEHTAEAIVSNLLAGACGDADLRQTLLTHAITLPHIVNIRKMLPFESVVVPFFVNFWNETFQNQRFKFQAPGSVEISLAEAITSPISYRAQATLLAVANGLSIPLHQELRNWLSRRDLED